MDKISYKLTEFEGPLDLLLHLISKNKLNIYDIEISCLLDQYIEHINYMKDNEMDIASEFLEMAAKLVYIKTVSLLPKHEESEQLKRELEGQLIEYSECKRIAGILSENMNFDSFNRKAQVIDFDMTYKRKHTLKELINAYKNVVGKDGRKVPPSKENFSGIVSRKIVSVTSRIIHVMRKLWKVHDLEYEKIFDSSNEKSELVATFLALLELIKGKRVRVEGEDSSLKIRLISGGVNSEN